MTAAFADGSQARLVPQKALRDCPCSCGATSVCRHRVATILAYQQAFAMRATPSNAPPPPSWTPAQVSEEALEKLLGAAALERARRLRKRGILVEVAQGDFERGEVPRAQLPTSTIRFLLPGDLSFARCDCRLKSGCEHVAIAVWAFQAAQAQGTSRLKTVELTDSAAESSERKLAALEAATEVASLLLLEGTTRLSEAASARFMLARTGLEWARLAWPLAAFEEVEALRDAYVRRSARYAPRQMAEAVAELHARFRAAGSGGALPASAILGFDEAPEVALDSIRLCALGVRVEEDGERRWVELFLAAPQLQSVLVLQKAYMPQGEKPEDGPALAKRTLLSGVPLEVVAHSQVVSNAAVRSPNRHVRFSTGPSKRTSILAGGASLDAIPPGLLVRNVQQFGKWLAARPPRSLRPRLAAENIRVFEISSLTEMGYDNSEQAVRAQCVDLCGHPFWIELHHRTITPGALGALARVLLQGKAKAVVGAARRLSGKLMVEPIALFAEKLVALHLEPSTPEGEQALQSLAPARAPAELDAVAQGVALARTTIGDAVHHGLRAAPPSWSQRLRQAQQRLAELGLAQASADFAALFEASELARATGAEADEASAVSAWATAALRLELLENLL